MTEPLCPYCLQSPSVRGGMTVEHVFVEGLGGRATIAVCERCNSTIGHNVEGPMMKHDQILNLARVVHLAKGKALRGRIRGDGTEVS